jgi:N-methylhydantoinase B
MRAFQVLMAPGSMVLALPPSSQSNHVELGAKIARLMTHVVSKAVPDRAVADDSGTSGAMIAGGIDNRPGLEGQPFGGAFVFGGGWGGTAKADGISFCQSSLYNCRAVIVEYTEKSSPIVVWEHQATIDTAGAGEHRGGYAGAYTIEALADTYMTPIVDSSKFPAEGLVGGGAAATSWAAIVTKDERGGIGSWNGIIPAERLEPFFGAFDEQGRPDPEHGEWGRGALVQTSKPTAYRLAAGKAMHLHIASAGGYGDPLDRDAEAVCRDVSNELLSPELAAEIYGVRLTPSLAVDASATTALRDELRARRGDGPAKTPMSYPRHWPLDEGELDALKSSSRSGARTPVEA